MLSYEYHFADITMIDNIENIIRNCQILIKTEVRMKSILRDMIFDM